MVKNIGILLFEGAVVLDYAGPFEVFYNAKRYLDSVDLEIFTIAEKMEKIDTKGLIVFPNYSIDDFPRIDILIIPGGTIENVIDNTKLMKWIFNLYQTLGRLVTVCNGIMVLPNLQIKEKLNVTTHYYYVDEFHDKSPESKIDHNKRFTDNGKILTSAGISAGIDLSFYLVEQYWGVSIAAKAAKMMEYDWKRTDKNIDYGFLESLIDQE